MRIKLLDNKRVAVLDPATGAATYDGYLAGSVLTVPDVDGKYLIDRGAAIETTEKIAVVEPPPDASTQIGRAHV